MPCYHPLTAYQLNKPGPSGKAPVFFTPSANTNMIRLPCGRCIGCKLERSKQWAVRLMHERQMHDRACYLTLTFSDEFLPADGSLNVDTFQKFMKRYRKHVGVPLRYFHCGEYGEENFRPHYHAIIFGHDFPDKFQANVSKGKPLYVSPTLQKLWPFGNHSIGDCEFESCAYVAGYVTKKITGDAADEHYKRVLQSTGEIVSVAPEYSTCSRNPPIGGSWFAKYGSEVYPNDRVVVRGRQLKPPRMYDKLLESRDLELHAAVKEFRAKARLAIPFETQLESEVRLPSREQFALLKQKTFSRRKGEF